MFYALAREIVSLIFHIYFKIIVLGRENIPKQKGSYIIASNHVSNNDPPMVGIVFKGKYTFMAKEELFRINPLFTWLIKKLGAFPVKRGSKDSAAIDNALESLNNGRIFVIFPEGTRSKDGELGKPKSGVTLVAARAKVPVVPVFVKYGKKRFLRRQVLVSIGEPIPKESFNVDLTDKRQIRSISELIMGRIAQLKESAPEII
ncbi:MAG: 1-acyl-sn-glycerol-3-phosphate acyltransferase [Oscillospiraceae bacterium]|nr:1-acyl-sn-glycerol-3-phosphate acyltransferase [Oscillospiraceae bacterium]